MTQWIDACAADAIEKDDLIRFDHGDRTFALYRTEDDKYYATDGLCTHEEAHLADGFVMDCVVECPLHQARFDIVTGKVLSEPADIDLKTYPVRVENGRVMIGLD